MKDIGFQTKKQMLEDHHDYELADKEWKSNEKEFPKTERCYYCKIPLKKEQQKKETRDGYQRPTCYDDNYNQFLFSESSLHNGKRKYGHPACILTEMVEQPYLHFLRASFLLHKYLRVNFNYCKTLVKAPPREILPSFGGPLPFAHFGEILQTQLVVCEHIYAPFYIPDMSLPCHPLPPPPPPPPMQSVANTISDKVIEKKLE